MTAVRRSAGILVYRRPPGGLEVLIGHMGGPFWEARDSAAWSVPKGEYEADEEPLAAARREFLEELGLPAPDGELLDLGAARQPSGKIVTIWAVRGDLDPDLIAPGTFDMEWPRGSGRVQSFPEIDKVAWFSLAEARDRLVAGQRVFLDRLARRVG
jgi:predicted NUDIX family NTP pyrophosphohydrolase